MNKLPKGYTPTERRKLTELVNEFEHSVIALTKHSNREMRALNVQTRFTLHERLNELFAGINASHARLADVERIARDYVDRPLYFEELRLAQEILRVLGKGE